MNVLLIGSGGREHALAWAISKSPKLTRLFIAPGNAGTHTLGENLPVKADDFEILGKLALEKQIGMVVVGPEDPLARGVHDYFDSHEELKKIPVIGPGREGARLESSKEFAKAFMLRHNIPTAAYKAFTRESMDEGMHFLETMKAPYVLKANGLAAGKGVLIIDDRQEAEKQFRLMLEGKFGEASRTVVIEEFMKGIELSVFALTDGDHYIILPEAKDYKRIGEGDTGLNTGGMGAVSPVPFADNSFLRKVEDRIIRPTIEGLKKENILYRGFIFFGLINCNGDPYLIEYNVRMGDPEAEVVIPRMECDMLDLFVGVVSKDLDKRSLTFTDKACTTVMLVSGGYPGPYEKGKEITRLDEVNDSIVFHAGTKPGKDSVLTNGGRVIALSSFGKNFREALGRSYKNAGIIQFDNKHFRKDIGFDL